MTESEATPVTSSADAAADARPPFRYDARLAGEIEGRRQDRWAAEGYCLTACSV